jgi:iron complex transport system substrate-binding protein
MIEAAGGEDTLGEAGRKSHVVGWDEVRAADPDVVVVMPCGLYADEALEQALGYRDELESLGAEHVLAVDAAASFSRPGPRLVEGTELLGHLLHPDAVPAPEGMGWRPVLEGART